MESMLAAIEAETGSDTLLTWVGERFLLEHGIAPWD